MSTLCWGQVYTDYSFWVNMFDAGYQSIVMFFVPFVIYFDTNVGIYEFGTNFQVFIHLFTHLNHFYPKER